MYQNQYSQQQRMSQPPAVLSTKDNAYLTDALSWELLAVKKAHSFASQCSDQQVKHQLEQLCQLHQQHYHTLLNHLSNNQQDYENQTYPHFHN
ncbi:MAG TPA: hypothetical protein DDZ66_12390 [Firmicutes bacterium]|mgnify:FL=1|jgi:ABC-type transporter MlaC component|nr:hypothetical protein [Bacillota bacterium]